MRKCLSWVKDRKLVVGKSRESPLDRMGWDGMGWDGVERGRVIGVAGYVWCGTVCY